VVQKTTQELASRLNQAVAAHPLAPPTSHGRVTWLMRELNSRTGADMSLNSVHKWLTGGSRPREDRIHDLAKLLNVDEVWLAFGKTPTDTAAVKDQRAVQANGASLVVAGLVELYGGRVVFQDGPVGMRVNMGGKDFGVCAVVAQNTGENLSVVVPEPVADARVVLVLPRPKGSKAAGHVDLVDVTDFPRKSFGGFSVLEARKGKDGRFSPLEADDWRKPLAAVADLAAA